jgi:hypothetical protein
MAKNDPLSIAKEEIRTRISLESVVQRHVKLKRMGAWSRGPCPFHGGEGDNFGLRGKSDTYYCFVCKASGDVFNFLMEVTGKSFMDVLRDLSQETGIELPSQSAPRTAAGGLPGVIQDIWRAYRSVPLPVDAPAWAQAGWPAGVVAVAPSNGEWLRALLESHQVTGTYATERGLSTEAGLDPRAGQLIVASLDRNGAPVSFAAVDPVSGHAMPGTLATLWRECSPFAGWEDVRSEIPRLGWAVLVDSLASFAALTGEASATRLPLIASFNATPSEFLNQADSDLLAEAGATMAFLVAARGPTGEVIDKAAFETGRRLLCSGIRARFAAPFPTPAPGAGTISRLLTQWAKTGVDVYSERVRVIARVCAAQPARTKALVKEKLLPSLAALHTSNQRLILEAYLLWTCRALNLDREELFMASRTLSGASRSPVPLLTPPTAARTIPAPNRGAPKPA